MYKNRIQKIIVIMLCSLLSHLGLATTRSNDRGFYMSLQAGNTLQSPSCPLNSEVKRNGIVSRGAFGFDLNKYFGAELAVINYPDFEYSRNNYALNASMYSIDLLMKGTLPLFQRLKLVTKGGISRIQCSGDSWREQWSDNQHTFELDDKKYNHHGYRPMGSLGLSYALTSLVDINADYIKSLDCSRGQYTLGFTFKFR